MDIDGISLPFDELCKHDMEDEYDECEDMFDPTQRDIYIDGIIDEYAIRKYVIPIININKFDDEMEIPVEERMPIRIYLSSVGGEVLSGLAICDVLKASKTPTIAVTLSTSYSMAFLIHLACKYRYCYPSSSFLWHSGFANFQNSGDKVKDMYEFYAVKQEKLIKDFIIKHTKISKRLLNQKWRNEWYISAEESVELGICDKILHEII